MTAYVVKPSNMGIGSGDAEAGGDGTSHWLKILLEPLAAVLTGTMFNWTSSDVRHCSLHPQQVRSYT